MPTMEQANRVHLDALIEQDDMFSASVMLGVRRGETIKGGEKADEPEETAGFAVRTNGDAR